jgi:hypothetical protein
VRRAELQEIAGVPLHGQIYNVFAITNGTITRIEDYADRTTHSPPPARPATEPPRTTCSGQTQPHAIGQAGGLRDINRHAAEWGPRCAPGGSREIAAKSAVPASRASRTSAVAHATVRRAGLRGHRDC